MRHARTRGARHRETWDTLPVDLALCNRGDASGVLVFEVIMSGVLMSHYRLALLPVPIP